MPVIVLKATAAPGESAGREPPAAAAPLFRGNGDVDYVCGNCRFVIAAGMGPRQRVPYDRSTCPSCGAQNEFPAEFRA